MYAKRGRGGFRGAGSSKKTFTRKRSPSEDDEPAPASKKAKSNAEDEPFVPSLDTDNDKNPFIAVSPGIYHCACMRGRSA